MANRRSEQLTLLYSREEIARRVQELATSINVDFAGGELVIVGVLRGAFVFLADLIRQLTIPVIIDFIGASSYGTRTETSGQVTVTKDLQVSIAGRDVLLVEDIEDTGITLQALIKFLQEKAPRSIRVCTFIDKRERRVTQQRLDYVGFEIREGFIVGYGIDYADHYRELPEIYRIDTIESDDDK